MHFFFLTPFCRDRVSGSCLTGQLPGIGTVFILASLQMMFPPTSRSSRVISEWKNMRMCQPSLFTFQRLISSISLALGNIRLLFGFALPSCTLSVLLRLPSAVASRGSGSGSSRGSGSGSSPLIQQVASVLPGMYVLFCCCGSAS